MQANSIPQSGADVAASNNGPSSFNTAAPFPISSATFAIAPTPAPSSSSDDSSEDTFMGDTAVNTSTGIQHQQPDRRFSPGSSHAGVNPPGNSISSYQVAPSTSHYAACLAPRKLHHPPLAKLGASRTLSGGQDPKDRENPTVPPPAQSMRVLHQQHQQAITSESWQPTRDSNITPFSSQVDADHHSNMKSESHLHRHPSTLSPQLSRISHRPSEGNLSSPSSLNIPGSSQHQPASSGSSWRRLTKTRSLSTMAVKRSFSTPNVQQAAMADGAIPYSSDKRRNKLGYHRTSVACGHCRRRKIRCLLAKDDSKGRCSNCIRLKKDCNFYPVENTPTTSNTPTTTTLNSADQRPRSMSKPDLSTNQESNSGASSPSQEACAEACGHDHFPSTDSCRGYPASVPVTPTYTFSGSFEEGIRNNSIGSSASTSRSTNVSRKPSLAQMHAMPLSLKVDQAFMGPREGFNNVPRWDIPHNDPQSSAAEQNHTGLEDPSVAFWRLGDMPLISSPHSLNRISSYGPYETADMPEDVAWSQAPSRIGSVDQGIAYSIGSTAFQSDNEYGVPELVSASTSTASLTAPNSEPSPYAGQAESHTRPLEFYNMHQWDDHSSSVHGSFHDHSPSVKLEPFDSFYQDDDRYNLSNKPAFMYHHEPHSQTTLQGLSDM